MTTWRELITSSMRSNDSFDNIISSTISDLELDVEFDNGYGSAEGIPFTIWTNDYVYFPTEYDGAEGVARVKRDPDGKPTIHI